ncbi:unnamed protein product [Symbiodinium pilosum]|uniref:Uncharacterized protein n=1 Tax=Symbiodinium pilosum TaxID=2952 RepID=A0A812K2U8_SYMPI|nr:unnamed protein product [Symbiodinium pilosum]
MKSAALDICEALGSVCSARELDDDLSEGIVQCATCPTDTVRQRTVQALGVVSDPAIPNKVLPKLLEDSSLLVSKMAVALAGKIGAPAATHAAAVARHLTSFDPDLRKIAAQSLGQLGRLPPSTAKDIAATFKSEKREEVRILLIQALGTQGPQASPFAQLFHTSLKESSVTMRCACIHALGCIGEDAGDHAPAIASLALTDADESVRQQAVQALGQLGRPGIFALVARLEDQDAANRQHVLEAFQVLCKLPVTQEAGPAVMRALKDGLSQVRGAACMTLAMLAAAQVEQESQEGSSSEKAEEEDKLYQLKVESGLVRRRGTDQAMLVANKLAGLLEEDDSPEVQAGALHGLRALGPSFAAPHAQILAGFAGASSSDFRQTVLSTLGGLQEAALPFVDLLVSHLGLEGNGNEADVEVQTAAAAALANLGTLAMAAAPSLARRLFSGNSTSHGSDPQVLVATAFLADAYGGHSQQGRCADPYDFEKQNACAKEWRARVHVTCSGVCPEDRRLRRVLHDGDIAAAVCGWAQGTVSFPVQPITDISENMNTQGISKSSEVLKEVLGNCGSALLNVLNFLGSFIHHFSQHPPSVFQLQNSMASAKTEKFSINGWEDGTGFGCPQTEGSGIQTPVGATMLTECMENTVGQCVIAKLEASDAEVRQGAVDFLYHAMALLEDVAAPHAVVVACRLRDPRAGQCGLVQFNVCATWAALRFRPTVVLRRARTVPKAFQNKSPNVLRAHAVPEYTCPSVQVIMTSIVSIPECIPRLAFSGEGMPQAFGALEHAPEFSPFECDTDPEVRLCCVEALGRFGEDASASAASLAKRLADDSEMVWQEAFEALRKIGPAGPAKLAESIQSASTPQVQQRAVDFLGAFGKAASQYAPIVAGLLGCGAEKLEKSAVSTLKSMGADGAAAVTPILLHPEPPVHDSQNMLDDEIKAAQLQRRLVAAAALRELGEDSFGQATIVAHCLHEQEPKVRKEAVITLRSLSVSGANALGALLDENVRLDVRVLAIDTLGKMGDAAREWIAPLAKCLEDKAPEVRRSAAVALCLALGELASANMAGQVAEHVELLAAGVHDGDALARRRCIETLGKLGTSARPYTEALAQILEGIDSWNWTPVASALAELGTATSKHADILADSLAHDTRSVRWSAASALSKLGPTAKETIPPLVQFLKSEEVSLRCIGTQALMVIAEGPNSLEESFLPLLSDADAKVREHACEALARCGCKQTNLLVEKLTDAEPFVRRAAATSLGELGEPAAKHAGDLVELLLDYHTTVAMAAAKALIALGAAGAEALMQRLLKGGEAEEEERDGGEDVDAEPENGTLERIMLDAMQGAPEHIIEPYADVLVVFLAANQPEIRLAAWACLSKVSETAFEFMVKRASDSHIVVRKGVAEAIAFLLSGMGVESTPTGMQRKAAETLAEQLTDPSDVVRLQACEAFRRIGGPLAEAHMSDLARRLQEHDVRVYRSVLDVLGNLGVAAAQHVSLIRARLEVPDVNVRRSAATAMGKMGSAGVASVPMLVLRLEEDSDSVVKKCAVEALGSLGAFSKQSALHIAKTHANRLASHLIMNEVACIRQACAEAIGKLGPPACGCLHELVLALGDSDLKVRRAAAHALAGLGEGSATEAVALIRSLEDTVDLG